MQDTLQEEPTDAPKLKGQDWIDSFLEKSSTEPLLSQPSAVVESEEKPLVKEEEKQTPVVEGDEPEEEEAPAEPEPARESVLAIPAGVTAIGAGALKGLGYWPLDAVILPEGVEEIGAEAFAGM